MYGFGFLGFHIDTELRVLSGSGIAKSQKFGFGFLRVWKKCPKPVGFSGSGKPDPPLVFKYARFYLCFKIHEPWKYERGVKTIFWICLGLDYSFKIFEIRFYAWLVGKMLRIAENSLLTFFHVRIYFWTKTNFRIGSQGGRQQCHKNKWGNYDWELVLLLNHYNLKMGISSSPVLVIVTSIS